MPTPALSIRRGEPPDLPSLERLVAADGLFTAAEQACALELITGALADPAGDYRLLVAQDQGGALLGYVCYGPTPMTESTWDLYWIVTAPQVRGRGVGRALCAAMEAAVKGQGGRLVRVETSSMEGYGQAQRFYARLGYEETCRVEDFYKPGDALLLFFKRL